MSKTLLCIPTLNSANFAPALIASIRNQIDGPDEVLVIDSSSSDSGPEQFRAAGFIVHTIQRSEFNHGRTRRLAFDVCPWADFVVFQTQDALLESTTSYRDLVATFLNPRVGAAYGRQLPHINAGPIESHARIFNYPAKSQVRSIEDVPSLGIRSVFISNSFAAYRATAYQAVGGFAENVIVGEDAHLAARLISAGWSIAYCAGARVYHSHDYSIGAEFSRYFDTGVFHSRESWLRDRFGYASGEGARFVRSEIGYLWTRSPNLIPSAVVRTAAKYIGYQLGLRERLLPVWAKRRFSMHKFYWK